MLKLFTDSLWLTPWEGFLWAILIMRETKSSLLLSEISMVVFDFTLPEIKQSLGKEHILPGELGRRLDFLNS